MTLQRIATLVALSVSIAACASSAVEEDTGEVAPMDTATTDTSTVRTDTSNVPPTTPTPSRADSAAYPSPTPDTTTTDTTQTMLPTDTAAAGTGTRWTATLAPTPAAMTDTTGGAGQVSGTVTVTPGMGASSTNAEITVSGLASGNSYPWHVHSGSCATGGPIVGPPDAYTPLTVSSGGSADAKATIPIATPSSGQYHVNVHKSPTELSVIIACGDLTSGQ